MELEQSLTRATLLAIALAVIPGAMGAYAFMRKLALEATTDRITKGTAAVITSHVRELRDMERSVVALAGALSQRLDEPPRADEIARFDDLVERDAQGVVRNRRDRFDGSKEAGVFIPPDVTLTDDVKRRKWRAMRTLTSFGQAALQHVDGVWFDQLDKTSVIFWRRDPNFIYTLPPDHDYTQTLWDRLASPKLNPQRKPMWTPAILETTVGTWVVSCVAPLDRNGQWIGIVGHDIALSELIKDFQATQFYDGTQHFLVDLDSDRNGQPDQEGSYILAGAWQKALEAKSGEFKPDLSAEPQLRALLWGDNRSDATPVSLGEGAELLKPASHLRAVQVQGIEYLATVVDLNLLHWRYVSLVPVTSALSVIHKGFAITLVVQFLTVLSAVFFLRSWIRRQIVEPLSGVFAMVRAHTAGDLHARCRMPGRNKIARLGQAVDNMADTISASMQAISASESRYRMVVENVREVIFQCDTEMRFQFLNAVWTTLTGRAVEDCLGHPITEYLHPEDVERKRREFKWMCDENANACFGTYRLLGRNGEVRWVEIHLQCIGRDASGHVCIGTIDDVTERLQSQKTMLRLQEQLRQSQKMEALGRLTGGVAHDFNNILAIMLGYTEMAIDRDPAQGNGALKSMLQHVMQAGERGRDLVAKMLTFSRRRVAKPLPTEVAPIIAEAAVMLRATIPAGIEIVTDSDAHGGVILVDPTALHQLLMNLVINARDAMPHGGRIGVRLRGDVECQTACTACHAEFRGHFVEIAVQDNGAGIAADLLPKIFDPFFTTKEIGRGSGMGLSVVHGIVHESNGHIVVESREGEGTTVKLLFPPAMADASVKPRERMSTAMPARTGKASRVMIVDDESALTELWARALPHKGYEVATFTDGISALAAFKASPDGFDAIVVDQSMPGMSGKDFAQEVLAVRPDTPIVLCTGFSDTIDAAGASAIGIRKFLMKPVSIPEMVGALNEVLPRSPNSHPERM